ncbi:MAG: hypothetical protein ACKVOR_06240 [Flavobacteriales bacterium]
MKKVYIALVALAAIATVFSFKAATPAGSEFIQVTSVESVVPGGLGRSRFIVTDSKGQLEEVKLENFFSLVGINFENIRNNDQMVATKLGELTAQGWELTDVSSGAYSGGADGGTGIFITRYLFKRSI